MDNESQKINKIINELEKYADSLPENEFSKKVKNQINKRIKSLMNKKLNKLIDSNNHLKNSSENNLKDILQYLNNLKNYFEEQKNYLQKSNKGPIKKLTFYNALLRFTFSLLDFILSNKKYTNKNEIKKGIKIFIDEIKNYEKFYKNVDKTSIKSIINNYDINPLIEKYKNIIE